ncbi:hypothetical protein ACFSQ3_05545 [Sphingobacterium corticis]|uniref:Uncharacterized protein n=1 Tax=Sphingobacterium corticis TaxID=1812823 RepID=A0ABW5NGZ1_9SPHI
MKEQDIDKLFREGLENHPSEPSTALWDKIAKQLDEEQTPVHTLPKEKNGHWWRYATAACALIAVGLFAYLRQENIKHSESTKHIAQVSSIENISSEDSESTTAGNVLKEDKLADDASESEVKGPKIIATFDQQEDVRIMASTISPRNDVKKVLVSEPALAEELVNTEPVEIPTVRSAQMTQLASVDMPTRYVTEVDPIKPIIEPFEEEEDMMIAGTVRKATSQVFKKIINVVSENTTGQIAKDIFVTKDEEGSLRLEVGNLFAKNRTKKRR